MRKQTCTQEQQISSNEPTLAERIRLKRAREGLTQKQAAKAWGVSVGTLQFWEQGRSIPRGFALTLLEKFLKGDK